MKNLSRKKKSLPLDVVLANVETDIAQLVAGIVAERRASPQVPRRRVRAAHAKGHANAA